MSQNSGLVASIIFITSTIAILLTDMGGSAKVIWMLASAATCLIVYYEGKK